jgi:hypothetical protein
MKKILFKVLLALPLVFGQFVFAEDREVFEEIPPPPSVYDSDYALGPEVTIRNPAY